MNELTAIEYKLLEVLTEEERSGVLRRFWEVVPHLPALREEGPETVPCLGSIAIIACDLTEAEELALWTMLVSTYYQSKSPSFWAFLPSVIAKKSLQSVRQDEPALLPTLLATILPKTVGIEPKCAMIETALLIKRNSASPKEHAYANSLATYIRPMLHDSDSRVNAYATRACLRFPTENGPLDEPAS